MTPDVLTADAAGWIAAMLTACCFASTRMLRPRALALMANPAFIAYGSLAGLLPVLALHPMLAPLNAWHLARHWRAARAAVGAGRN